MKLQPLIEFFEAFRYEMDLILKLSYKVFNFISCENQLNTIDLSIDWESNEATKVKYIYLLVD